METVIETRQNNHKGATGAWERRAGIAVHLLEACTRADLPYCVLRGHEGLPETVRHDLDLALLPGHIDAFEDVLGAFAKKHGYSLVDLEHRVGYASYGVVSFKPSPVVVLHVDVWSDFHWKGLNWLATDTVVGTRMKQPAMVMVSPGVAAFARLIKEVLHTGTIRPAMREQVAAECHAAGPMLDELLVGLVGPSYQKKFRERIDAEDWDSVAQLSKGVRLRLLWNSVTRHPLATLSRVTKHVLSIFRRVIRPHGQLVVLIGPDGSGKTTLSRLLTEVGEGQLFPQVHYIHGRYGILPDLGRLLGKKSSETTGPGQTSGRPLRHGMFKASLMLFYYTVDFILAQPKVRKWKAQGHLILADRYFYDYYFQREWDELPRWLIKVFSRLIPTPDLLVHTYCPPAVIRERKPELPAEEISRQHDRMREFIGQSRRAVVVPTDVSENEALESLLRVVIGQPPELGVSGPVKT